MKLSTLALLLSLAVQFEAASATNAPNWEERVSSRRWPTDWTYIPSATRFTVNLTNNVLRPGGTNYALCRVENHSTNVIHITRPFRTSLLLIVKPTQAYHLTPVGSGPGARYYGGSIGPGQACEWLLDGHLKEAVPAGDYQVGAVEWVGVYGGDTNHTRYGPIISDLVDVKVEAPVK
jgi:hypothetical protein